MRAARLAVAAAARILCVAPPAAAQCADFDAFVAMSAPLNSACCEGAGADCTAGMPNVCTEGCAAVLLPMRAAGRNG